MRFRDMPSEDDLFCAAFRRHWERRFDQAAPLWAVELARAFKGGQLAITGQPTWPALTNIARIVQGIKGISDGCNR
jgi:hypothetical protein